MYTIEGSVTNTTITKKSKFIAFLQPVFSSSKANELIKQLKNQYKDATHVCYAYIINENEFKYYDDGEPQNTAGLPIYKSLCNKNLSHIICVVVRYFGGIKLGANGLVHAYSDSALSAIEESKIIPYRELSSYIIEISYSDFDTLNHYLNKNEIAITDKQFLDNILVSFNAGDEEIKEIKELFPNITVTKN